ncbi:hypothetical protein EG329_002452 [Mollisiaceae sp. DMI_Dod_QoI]|nr:hypothetical protein EG329_002452 [Helotiales sp. DMI_Dod_QoI]
MVQETSIFGQVSEKGTELLRVSSIPENLWPEAIQHAVWLKTRTPARALRKKDVRTPYEALKGDKPTLTREGQPSLHSPRGWLGYFVGCESEAMYHIYSPEKHKIYRTGGEREIYQGITLDESAVDGIPFMDDL